MYSNIDKNREVFKVKRVILIVMDSLGVGEMPDAENYGDSGANTLGHIKEKYEKLYIPNLVDMGLGNIEGVDIGDKAEKASGDFGKAMEKSIGKDTITGHWEITGVLTKVPFKTFKKFPDSFIKNFEKEIGIGTLGNYAASGTEIIEVLGPEHERTGKPIVYTSADSVFQIAANINVVPLEELYRYCEIARKLLKGDLQVGRVIARPYVMDESGKRTRTSDRKDYAVSPPHDTVLSLVKKAGYRVYAVGKIRDIYNGAGISDWVHIDDNMDGVDKTVAAIKERFSGIIFTNLVDFDSKYGHRRDPVGYAKAIEDLDGRIPEIKRNMKEDDVLILCADHGNDPTYKGWDHTREMIPILVYGKNLKPAIDLGIRKSFADIGATICEYLNVEKPKIGESFLDLII